MAGLFDQYEQAASGRPDVTGGSASSQQLVTKTKSYSFIINSSVDVMQHNDKI